MAEATVSAEKSHCQDCYSLYWTLQGTISNYGVGIFHYEQEYVQYIFCLDVKHRIEVGEPNFPVAATERGRQVLTVTGSHFLLEIMILQHLVSSHQSSCVQTSLMISLAPGTLDKSILKDGALEASSHV